MHYEADAKETVDEDTKDSKLGYRWFKKRERKKHCLGLAQSIAKRWEITKKEELWTEGRFQIMTWKSIKCDNVKF